VQRAMAKQPDERFANVSELVEALTGKPLLRGRPTSLPPPDVGFATGSRAPHTGHDAYAQTMGSGDHRDALGGKTPREAALGAQGAQTPREPFAGAVHEGRANAATVESRGLAGATRAMPASPSRSRMWILVLAIGGAMLAAVVMYLVMRDRGEPARSEPTPVVAPAVAVDAAVAAPVVDAAVAVVTPDAAAAVTKPKTKNAAPPAAREDDEAGDEAAAAKLKDAMAALQAGKLTLAETQALGVTSSEYATPRQRARGKMIYGIARCKNHDEERAQNAARELEAYKALRAKLVEACHREGYLQGLK